jgi:ankyrin repeat protein
MNHYPLHQKVLTNDLKGVQELIERKVSLEQLDDLGQTALHWAVFGGYLAIAEVLLKAGANPNVFSRDGESVTWRASDFGFVEMEALLKSFEGRINANEK